MEPRKAGRQTEWQTPFRPAAIALVIGPEGLSMGKVKSLVTHNQQLVNQIADYAEQTSKVEGLVQELSDAEQSGGRADAVLKGFAAHYGVSAPRLDPTASKDQQASVLLQTLLPAASNYDPLSAGHQQVQQSTGLAASVAGLFFGNAVGLAAGSTALVAGIKGAMFPGIEFRSAFAQNEGGDGLALCTKAPPQKPRTRVAYLWAYRVPNLEPPVVALRGGVHLPAGLVSTVHATASKGTVRELARARDWRLVPVTGGPPVPVPVQPGTAPDSLTVDLSHAKVAPGDYTLAATWDWDALNLAGTVHVHALGDLSHVHLAPGCHDRLVEGSGTVTITLSGADFEFLEKAGVAKAGVETAKIAAAHFTLPLGPRQGPQNTVRVEIDTAARGAYRLLLTQSGGRMDEVPLTVQPRNPALTELPVRVNRQPGAQPLRLTGSGLDRVEAISSEAGEIHGAAADAGWTGTIELKPDAVVGTIYALSLKVKGLDGPLKVPGAIKVFGARPVITGVRKAIPDTLGLTLRPDELPSGTTVGLSLEIRQYRDPSSGEEGTPRVELGCKSGGLRSAIKLSPDAGGSGLRVAAPGLLFLSIDPGTVGYPGCLLTATVEIEPEGRSGATVLGKVIRVPKLDEFTLTNEQIDPSTYAGVLKGRDLDVIEKTGWDPHHGVPVQTVPAPVPGDAAEQTMRVALPWPAPAPHAPLYVWLRGEAEGRKTTVSY
ncbi:MAG: hypothetical protein JST11_00075 [Acidobacteria bacterium]|nr:hypothetical protein [Acidobacteriota bacterium]